MPTATEHPPAEHTDVLQEWLNQFGFQENPFALRQAGLEERLDEYFVQPPGFERARGPHTFLLFAPRGGGKTACRITVERACRPYDSQSERLAVPYYQALENLVARMDDDWTRVGYQRHVEALLRLGLRTLHTDLVSRQGETLYADQLAFWRGLVDRYAPELVAPRHVLFALRQAGALRGGFDLQRVLDAFGERKLRRALEDVLAPESRAGETLISLVDSPSLPMTELSDSPAGLAGLAALTDLARAVGVRSFLVMVDGLDESPLPSADADQAALLIPLIDSRLMEHEFFVFKFFLPAALLPIFESDERVRDRLKRLLHQVVSWPDGALRELLRLRLMAFSDGRVQSLQALFDSPAGSEDIDARLVRWANGSPRLLLELGDKLLNHHCQRYEPASRLTAEDLAAVDAMFQVEYAPQVMPRLSLDEKSQQIRIGDHPINQTISATEFKLLWYLYQHVGEIKSKDDVWREVWGYSPDAVSDTAIDSLVFRTRQKIEKDPRNPVYLQTVRGEGYRLLNTI